MGEEGNQPKQQQQPSPPPQQPPPQQQLLEEKREGKKREEKEEEMEELSVERREEKEEKEEKDENREEIDDLEEGIERGREENPREEEEEKEERKREEKIKVRGMVDTLHLSHSSTHVVEFSLSISTKHVLAVLFVVASVSLIACLFVGSGVSDTPKDWKVDSFSCPSCPECINGYEYMHWESQYDESCIGTNMAVPNAVQRLFIPPKNPILMWEETLERIGDNRYNYYKLISEQRKLIEENENYTLSYDNFEFSLYVRPYTPNWKDGDLYTTVKVKTELYGFKEYPKNGDFNVAFADKIWTQFSEEEIVCYEKRRSRCTGFYLFVQRPVQYPYYEVDVQFLKSPGKQYIQNVKWEFYTPSAEFNSLQMTFRYIYVVISLLVSCAWVWPLRNLSPYQWPFEQQAVGVLLVSLFLFNNPLVILFYFASSWFWTFLDNFFQISFVCVLFLFWFVVLERARYHYTGSLPLKWRGYTNLHFQLLSVGVYGFMALVTAYLVDNSKLHRNWMMSWSYWDIVGDYGNGVIPIFYYLSLLCMQICIVWVIVMGMLHLPAASRLHPHLKITYMYLLALPTVIVVLCMWIGAMFYGLYGDYTQGSMGFAYFFGLFNAYVYILAFGYYPATVLSDMGKCDEDNGIEIVEEVVKEKTSTISLGGNEVLITRVPYRLPASVVVVLDNTHPDTNHLPALEMQSTSGPSGE